MCLIRILLLVCFACSCNAQNYRATFIYENAGIAGKSGSFQFYDTNNKQLFDVKASAGYTGFANNPYYQAYKDKGPIPAGTWYITGVKNEKNAILILNPGSDVLNLNSREGFLIHGQGENKTIEESSHGCIILPLSNRLILLEAYKRLKSNPLPVKIIAVVSGTTG